VSAAEQLNVIGPGYTFLGLWLDEEMVQAEFEGIIAAAWPVEQSVRSRRLALQRIGCPRPESEAGKNSPVEATGLVKRSAGRPLWAGRQRSPPDD